MTSRSSAWPGWVCAAIPWAFLLALAAAAVHVRLGLGHWPEPMREDYRTPAWSYHTFAIAWLAVSAAVVAPVVWGILLCFRPTRFDPGTHLRQAALFGIGWGIVALVLWADPWRLVTWWLD